MYRCVESTTHWAIDTKDHQRHDWVIYMEKKPVQRSNWHSFDEWMKRKQVQSNLDYPKLDYPDLDYPDF